MTAQILKLFEIFAHIETQWPELKLKPKLNLKLNEICCGLNNHDDIFDQKNLQKKKKSVEQIWNV